MYDIKFLSNLISRDQNCAHDSVDEDIFSKRMLLFPFHRQRQWSLVAVLNPGAIKTCNERDYKGGHPCMLFLDPLGPNTKHNKNIIASKLVMWLNKQWRDRPGAREDDVLPFSRHTMKGYTPKGKFAWFCSSRVGQFSVVTFVSGFAKMQNHVRDSQINSRSCCTLSSCSSAPGRCRQ